MTIHKHSRKVLGLALAFSLILTACASDSTEAPTTSGADGTVASVTTVVNTTQSDPEASTESEASGTSMGEATSSSEVSLPEPELTELTIGLSGEYTANVMHAIWAQHADLPPKYGFERIEFRNFGGAVQGVQALFAGQIDVTDNSGGPVVSSLATDQPLIMPFIIRHNMTDNMYAQDNVTGAEDLIGGSVAISSFGSQSHAGALLALDVLGLGPDDVTITQIGNDSARQAALQAGSVTASMNDAVQEQELSGLGFNILVRLAEEEGIGGVPRTSLTVPRSFIEEYPNTVLNLVAMYLEANTAWRTDAQTSGEVLAEYAEMPLEEAQADIDSALGEPWEPLDGRCDPTVMEFTRQTLLPTNPQIAEVNPSDGCTNEFIDQLEEMGFLAEIGVPGY